MAKKILSAPLKLLGIGKKKAGVEVAPPVMPVADDEAIRRAKRRSIAKQLGRGGRSSTLLTDSDSLGG
jgi:hypothetical protein